MSEQCARTKHSGYDLVEVRCHNKAKNFEDGKWWCTVHTPSVKDARWAARQQKWDEEHEASRKLDRLHAAAPAMLEALQAAHEYMQTVAAGKSGYDNAVEFSKAAVAVTAAIKQAEGS